MNNVYHLVNLYYGELRIAVGEEELNSIAESKDSWEIVNRDKYLELKIMYEAGKRDIRKKIELAISD
jgi:hypothetical protein